MRTKKLISVALLAAIGTTAQAQIVSSQSEQVIVTQEVKPEKPKKPKTPRTYKWYFKAGASLDDLIGSQNVGGMTIGYDVSLGILKPTNNEDLLWGLELGVMSMGSDDLSRKNAINFSPFIGYNIIDNGSLKIAPYIGPYASYTLGSWGHGHVYRWGGGINVGVGVWLSKSFCFDLHFKRALSYSVKDIPYYNNEGCFSQKIVLGVGLAF